jgi:hypothetical protein
MPHWLIQIVRNERLFHTFWFDAIDVNTYPGFLQTYLWFISKYPLL